MVYVKLLEPAQIKGIEKSMRLVSERVSIKVEQQKLLSGMSQARLVEIAVDENRPKIMRYVACEMLGMERKFSRWNKTNLRTATFVHESHTIIITWMMKAKWLKAALAGRFDIFD